MHYFLQVQLLISFLERQPNNAGGNRGKRPARVMDQVVDTLTTPKVTPRRSLPEEVTAKLASASTQLRRVLNERVCQHGVPREPPQILVDMTPRATNSTRG